MKVERLNPSAALPFEDMALLDHVRLTLDDIAEAQRIGRAAAQEIEHAAQVALLFQTVRVTTSWWPQPAYAMPLPVAPLLDASTVSVSVNGAPKDGWSVITGTRPELWFEDDVQPGEGETAVITYRAGFGATAASIPADLAHAILDQAAALYDLRGTSDRKGSWLSPHAARVIGRYRRVLA